MSLSSFYDEPKTSMVVHADVPFTSQAPFGDWSDPVQQDGCEEASSLMAIRWAREEKLSPIESLHEIGAITRYLEERFGTGKDTSAQDTAERILKGYFGYDKVEVYPYITVDHLRMALPHGLVIVPVDGRVLKNPFYTPPGPERHMLLIIGYDAMTDEFITHDPGTKHGQNYRYAAKTLQKALRDYLTGDGVPLQALQTAMILIRK